MIKVQFVVTEEEKHLRLPGSTSAGVSHLPRIPPIGLDITESRTGRRYRVVRLHDLRGSLDDYPVDYLAELESAT